MINNVEIYFSIGDLVECINDYTAAFHINMIDRQVKKGEFYIVRAVVTNEKYTGYLIGFDECRNKSDGSRALYSPKRFRLIQPAFVGTAIINELLL